ncbi:hypothetical protein Tco_1444350 [Tanacetum coccineum]
MDPNSSIGKICLGKDNRVSVNDGMESHRDWETPKLQGTACSQEKKEAKAFTFYRIEIDEVSERYIAPCFMNGLEAYDGVINLEQDKNLISNEFAVKLCLEHEVKDRDTVVKKELILALRGEIYFPLTQEKVIHEAIAIDIYKRFSILEEARPVIETMAYSDKYKKILDSIF